jgi:lysophospholipase L1-like esterase
MAKMARWLIERYNLIYTFSLVCEFTPKAIEEINATINQPYLNPLKPNSKTHHTCLYKPFLIFKFRPTRRIKFLVPIFLWVSIFTIQNAIAQKKVVIMGSSTAVGSGASTYQLSWAGRLEQQFNQNSTDGLDTLFYNIARSGYHTYNEVSISCIPPSGRPAPDPEYNVNKALSYHPDIVIINLPSNDVGAGFSITETMNNFRLMYSDITATGAKCYIATTQPRNDYSSLQRKALLDLADSIYNQFGFFSVNFWNDLVTTDGLNMLRNDRKEPTSNIHANNIGHEFLYNQVRNKNIFGITILPIALTSMWAQVQNDVVTIKWNTEQQSPNTSFKVERSANGKDFENAVALTINEARTSSTYSVIDKTPLPGKSFYRIKVSDLSRHFYSNTISVLNKNSGLEITKLLKSSTSSSLIVTFNMPKNDDVLISIFNTSGVLMNQQKHACRMPQGRIILPVSNLPNGQYFLKLSTPDNSSSIRSFFK